MLDSIYHMPHYLICTPLVVYRFHCMALYFFKTRRHVINIGMKLAQIGLILLSPNVLLQFAIKHVCSRFSIYFISFLSYV